jgi:hypothetical protein
MTKAQAIAILDQAISQIATTRQGHAKMMEALEVLAKTEGKEEQIPNGGE